MNLLNVNEILERVNLNLTSGKILEAQRLIKEGLKIASKNYSLLNLDGIISNALEDINTAIESFNKAIEVEPDKPDAYINLGIVFMRNYRFEEALKNFRIGVEKNPANSSSRYNFALALEAQGNIDEAIKQYEFSIKYNPQNHAAFTNLGMLYLLTGNFKKGFEYFEHRFYTGELKRGELPGKRWEGEIAQDKSLYVYADQGFGDVIQFSRLLKLARKRVGKIYFECQEELYDLMQSLEGYDELFTSSEDFTPKYKYDLQIPLMSLPYALQLTQNNIPSEVPYLHADYEKSRQWEKYFSNFDGVKVGITWRGNPVFRKNNIRSTTLEKFLSFLNPEVKLFSLQMNTSESEKRMMKENGIVDISNMLLSFADTAAALENLDLVISTDTSLPHLAGALGKPVWLMLSKIPDWRWGLTGNSSLWYPGMKIFRQIQSGKWDAAFLAAKNELAELTKIRLRK